MNITPEEIGYLKAIHNLVWRLAETTENEELAERLRKAFDALPYSEPDGLDL